MSVDMQDKELDKLLQDMDIEMGSAAQRAYSQTAYNESASEIRKKYVDKLKVLLLSTREEAEELGEFMAASRIQIEFLPLLVHRLESNFPTMTAEVIGNVSRTITEVMKPHLDKHKALKESNVKPNTFKEDI